MVVRFTVNQMESFASYLKVFTIGTLLKFALAFCMHLEQKEQIMHTKTSV